MTTATREASGTTEEATLVAAVRAGDDSAFSELFRRYSPRVTAFVRRMAGDHARAEDVTQEAFLSALRRMRATDCDIAFRPWIFEIAKNACIDSIRRTSRAEEVSMDADSGLRSTDHQRLVHGGPAPESALLVKERLTHLQGALDELPEGQGRILLMRELEGLSYREIGERLDLSRPAVQSALVRARRRLEQEYADLETGARCEAMGAAMARLAEGLESARDRRRLSRHIRRCSACRRNVREFGLSIEPARPLSARVAALLPAPLVLCSGSTGSRVVAVLASAAIAGGSAVFSQTLPPAPAAGTPPSVALAPRHVSQTLEPPSLSDPRGAPAFAAPADPLETRGHDGLPVVTTVGGDTAERGTGQQGGRGDLSLSLEAPEVQAVPAHGFPDVPGAPATPDVKVPASPRLDVSAPSLPRGPSAPEVNVPAGPRAPAPLQPKAPGVKPPATPSLPSVPAVPSAPAPQALTGNSPLP